MEEINVRKVFAEKNPKLAKLMPGFVFGFIERVIHQKEMNDFLKQSRDKTGVEFIEGALDFFDISLELKGLENLPENGRCIFVSNHPLGGLDGIVLMKLVADKYGSSLVLANDILMNVKNLEHMFVPINKHGSHNKSVVAKIDECFDSENPIITFPAGLCSRKIKGQIVDLEWKKSFVAKAVATHRDVVPMHFGAKNSNFFYNLANIRKKIGLKANIEMFYLPDEMFKQKGKTFTITFGKSIPYTTFSKEKNPLQWVAEVKEHVYKLQNNPSELFNV